MAKYLLALLGTSVAKYEIKRKQAKPQMQIRPKNIINLKKNCTGIFFKLFYIKCTFINLIHQDIQLYMSISCPSFVKSVLCHSLRKKLTSTSYVNIIRIRISNRIDLSLWNIFNLFHIDIYIYIVLFVFFLHNMFLLNVFMFFNFLLS